MNSIVALPLLATPVSSPLFASAPPDRRALEAYAAWLFFERRLLCHELWPHTGGDAENYVLADNAGFHWHMATHSEAGNPEDTAKPTLRAAAVLDLVGVNWRVEKRDMGLNHEDSGKRPAMPACWPQVDGDLVTACAEVQVLDLAIKDLLDTYGDDADSREDYLAVEEKRWQNLHLLSSTPARSWAGVVAKAEAISSRCMGDDDCTTSEVARSMAEDITRLSNVIGHNADMPTS